MGRNALRRIHEFDAANLNYPTVDELQLWIESNCNRATEDFRPRKFEKMAEEAAIFALSTYDPEVYAAAQRRGRNGGKKAAHGKRPTKYTVLDLAALPQGLSIPEQAKRLGCSAATISRIRAEAKALETQTVQDELDTLLANAATPAPITEAQPSEFDYLLEPVESEVSVEDDWKAVLADMGAYILASGTVYIPDPNEPRMTLERVFEGLV
jgi:hypothetical protein